MGWSWLPAVEAEDIVLGATAVLLVLVSGLMSGLTLGLMSIDKMDLEIVQRTGTDHDRMMAARIAPIISNQHYLLVTLLLFNAAAAEALPLVIDRLADPLTAVLISVTVVLIFGEIIPQSVCGRWAPLPWQAASLRPCACRPSPTPVPCLGPARWLPAERLPMPGCLPACSQAASRGPLTCWRSAGTGWRWARTAAGWCGRSCSWPPRWPGL
jgi:hypothetical protein